VTISHIAQCVGGVVSPILSNIYLDRLDKFVETELIPEYTRGAHKARNPAYTQVEAAIKRARRRGDSTAVRTLRRQQRRLPARDPRDPGYRRLRYVRYADDHLLGFIGPTAEAEQIKQRLATFLRDDLKLDLSEEKTLITHARTGAARFLGYNITILHNDRKITRKSRCGGRKVNGTIGLHVPPEVIKAKSALFLQRGKPARRTRLAQHDDHTIINTYGSEYRGIVQYYLLAGDVWRLSRLRWVMVTSMLKTLACKHHSTVSKMAARYMASIPTPHGPRRCFQATAERDGKAPLTARFDGIPLRQNTKAVPIDREPIPVTLRRKELVNRLLAGRCEICKHTGAMEVHHVAKLADLATSGQPQPEWAECSVPGLMETIKPG
jgi:hypothetical protein